MLTDEHKHTARYFDATHRLGLEIEKETLMKNYYVISKKKGRLRAIVANARKLATRIHFVIKMLQPYGVGVVK